MSSRKCIFISTDTHEKLSEHIDKLVPKVSIGNFAEAALLRFLSFEDSYKGKITIKDIQEWKKAWDESKMPPTNLRQIKDY